MDKRIKENAKKYEIRFKFCNDLEQKVKKRLEKGDIEYSSIQVEDKKLLKEMLQYMIETPRFIKILKYIDFTGITAEGNNCASKQLQNTNLDIDPQTVLNKTLYGANLENHDMSDKDYSGSCIINTNLKNTNSFIDLAKIKGSIEGTNLTNCTCVATFEELSNIVRDDYTEIDKTVFLDKDKYDKDTDSYQVIATPIAKRLIKKIKGIGF